MSTIPNVPRSDDDVLRVEDLSVHFPTEDGLVKSVDGIDFRVGRGEILCIVGESGSGKSVTAQTVLGLHKGTRAQIGGRVLLGDEDLVALPEDRMRRLRGEEIAMIFQNPLSSLHPFYKVGNQVAEAYRAHHGGGSGAEAKRRALEMLKAVGIPNAEARYEDYPHQFSGGMRQRAMIAMALINDPRILIADEPTTALDVTIQAEILRLLRDLRDRTGSAIMLITHDMGVVAEVADRVVVMRHGKVVESGTADEIFYRPQHEYTKQLLAAVPRLQIGDAADEQATEETEAPIVAFHDATIEYPSRGRGKAFKAVTGLDLEIRPGEIVGLVGESGSGKSTIGRALIGLVPVTEGSLTVEGVDMRHPSRRDLRRVRRDLGIVFQDPAASLNPRYPVGQSIAEPLALAGKSRKEVSTRVEELLDSVELPRGFRNRYPHELSGGQQQRIGIARALALTPKLLVADEPTSALDVSVQARFLDLLQELQQRLRFACLFISHDLAVVDLLSDRIVVMSRGRMVEQGTADQVLRAPREEYTRKLIAAVPVPDPQVQAERRAAALVG